MGKLKKLGLVIAGIAAVATIKSRLGGNSPEPITPIDEESASTDPTNEGSV